MQENALTQKIASTLWERKAFDIVALDVRGLTVLCDYMVIASGRNANQVKALADDVQDMMEQEGAVLRRAEGVNEGRWAVLDYGQILVHLFHPDERTFYHLERLWEDGGNRLTLPFDQTKE